MPATRPSVAERQVPSSSPEATRALAAALASAAQAGDLIALHGDLGAGKTQFAKGFGAGLGVTATINSPSYVLMAGGWSAILLGVFYQVVDVWKFQSWCQPFVWIGTNSITIYLAANILGGFNRIAARFVGGDVKAFFDTNVARGLGDLVVALVGLGLVFWFCGFLHRKKIFLRI